MAKLDERACIMGEIRRHDRKRIELLEQAELTGNPRTERAAQEQRAIITALEKGLRVMGHAKELRRLMEEEA